MFDTQRRWGPAHTHTGLGHPPAAGGTLEENHCGSVGQAGFCSCFPEELPSHTKSKLALLQHLLTVLSKTLLLINIIISGKGKTSQDTEGSDQLFKNALLPSTASPSLQHFQLMKGQSPATFPRHAGGGGITQRKLQSRRTLQIQIQSAGQ